MNENVNVNTLTKMVDGEILDYKTIHWVKTVSAAELLFVCCVAAILVVGTFFSFITRRRVMSDYWLPDGSKVGRLKSR